MSPLSEDLGSWPPGSECSGLAKDLFCCPCLHHNDATWWNYERKAHQSTMLLEVEESSNDLRSRCSLLAASVQPGCHARVAIVTSCIDGSTTNPLTWCALCTEFPMLHFNLVALVPDDANPRFGPVEHASSNMSWVVYDVDLLAQLYPTTPNELADIIQPVTCER